MQQRNRCFLNDLPILLGSMVIQKWTQLRNRRFLKDTQKIIQEGGLDVEADATAEQVFSKRPLHFLGDIDHIKVDATAQQTFLKRPPQFF